MINRSISRRLSAIALTAGLLLPIATLRAADPAPAAVGVISGKVTKADGSAAASIPVRLMKAWEGGPGGDRAPRARREDPAGPAEPGKGPKRERPKAVAEATTGTDGTFTLPSVPVGEYQLIAGARGEGMAREKVNVKAGETVTVNLELKVRAPKGDK